MGSLAIDPGWRSNRRRTTHSQLRPATGRIFYLAFLVAALCCALLFPLANGEESVDTDYSILKMLGQEPIGIMDRFLRVDGLHELEGNSSSVDLGNNSSLPIPPDNDTATNSTSSPSNSTSNQPNPPQVINYEDVFRLNPYDYGRVVRYDGWDATSEYSAGLSISSQYIAVGANGYDKFTGVVHMYVAKNETAFDLVQTLYPPTGSNINFGVSIDLYGDSMLIGASAYNLYSGIAYIYINYEGFWVLSSALRSPMSYGQGFGRSVALFDDIAVVGTGVNNAFVFEKVNLVWKLVTVLQPVQEFASFGRRVDIYGNTLVIGAALANDSAGAVFVYNRIAPQTWSHMSTLQSVEGYNSYFGFSVAIFESTIAVGAPGYQSDIYLTVPFEDWSNNENNTGWVHLFALDPDSGGSKWNRMTSIQSPVGPNSYFGSDVSLNKDYLAVGAEGYPNATNLGSAFMYRRYSATNVSMTIAFPSPGIEGEHFGASVRLSTEYNTVVGAYGYDKLRGAIYLAPLPKPGTSGGGTSGGNSNSVGTSTSSGATLSNGLMGLLAILMLLLLLTAVAVYTCGWNVCCCCCKILAAPPLKKKKKKDEEDDSPYTVHSYVGYSEMDDEYSYSTGTMPSTVPYPHRPAYMYPPPSQKELEMDKEKALAMGISMSTKDGKKGGDGVITSASEGFVRQMFPYKVYSYHGYEEDRASMEAAATIDRQINEKMLPPADHETMRNTMANAQSSFYPSSTHRGPASMPSMHSMHSNSQSSMGTSDYYGPDRQIYSEASVMENILSDRAPGLPRLDSHQTILSESVEYASLNSMMDATNSQMGGSFFQRHLFGSTAPAEMAQQQQQQQQPPQPLSPSNISNFYGFSDAEVPSMAMDGMRDTLKRAASKKVAAASSESSDVFTLKGPSDEESSHYISSAEDEESRTKSMQSYVSQARAQYLELMKKRASLSSGGSGNDSGSGSHSYPFSSPDHCHLHFSSQEDNSSVVSQLSDPSGVAGNQGFVPNSLVNQARQQYTVLMKKLQSSSDSGSADHVSGVTMHDRRGSETTDSEPPQWSSPAAVVPVMGAYSMDSTAHPAENTTLAVNPLVAQARARYSAVKKRVQYSGEYTVTSDSSSVPSASTSQSSSSSVASSVASTNSSDDSSLPSTPPVSIVSRAKNQYAEFMAKRQQAKAANVALATAAPLQEEAQHVAGRQQEVVAAWKPPLPPVREQDVSVHAIADGTTGTTEPAKNVVPPPPPLEVESTFVKKASVKADNLPMQTFIRPTMMDDASTRSGPSVASSAPVSPPITVQPLEDHRTKASAALAAARQRILEEEAKARLTAQSVSEEEHAKRIQERNRLKEDSKLRAEERARARFALFKAKAEEAAKLEGDLPQTTEVSSVGAEVKAKLAVPIAGSHHSASYAAVAGAGQDVVTPPSSSSPTRQSKAPARSALLAARSTKASSAATTTTTVMTTSSTTAMSSSATMSRTAQQQASTLSSTSTSASSFMTAAATSSTTTATTVTTSTASTSTRISTSQPLPSPFSTPVQDSTKTLPEP